MIKQLNEIDNIFEKAYVLDYLMSAKKISKQHKNQFTAQFANVVDTLAKDYYLYESSVNIRDFTNTQDYMFNLTPKLSIDDSNSTFSIHIKYTIRTKPLALSVIEHFALKLTPENIRIIKKFVSEEESPTKGSVILLAYHGNKIKVDYSEIAEFINDSKTKMLSFVEFSLPMENTKQGNFKNYPIVFPHFSLVNGVLNMKLYAEHPLTESKVIYTLPKSQIRKRVSSWGIDFAEN